MLNIALLATNQTFSEILQSLNIIVQVCMKFDVLLSPSLVIHQIS